MAKQTSPKAHPTPSRAGRKAKRRTGRGRIARTALAAGLAFSVGGSAGCPGTDTQYHDAAVIIDAAEDSAVIAILPPVDAGEDGAVIAILAPQDGGPIAILPPYDGGPMPIMPPYDGGPIAILPPPDGGPIAILPPSDGGGPMPVMPPPYRS